MKRRKQAETAATNADAARQLGVDPRWVQRAGRAASIRTPGGRVRIDAVRRWIASHREELENPELSTADQKLVEQIRRLRHQNDREAAGLVPRAWVYERFQKILGEAHVIRERSIEDHPRRYLAAGGDIARCREVTRGIWDSIMLDLQGLAKHMEEPPKV